MPPGANPTTPVLDAFNRANSGSLGSAWSSPITVGDSQWEINANQAVSQNFGSSPISSYWNTVVGAGNQEAYCDVVGGSQTLALLVKMTNPGTSSECDYRITTDHSSNTTKLLAVKNGVGTTLATYGANVPAGGKMWIHVEPTGTPGTFNVYGFVDLNDGSGWRTVGAVSDNTVYSSDPSSSYVGVRGFMPNGDIDNFGGGLAGTNLTITVPAGRATASAVVPTIFHQTQVNAPAGSATAASVAPVPKAQPAIPPGVMNLTRPIPSSSMSTAVPYGTMTLSRVAPVPHTDIPAYPPIVVTPPPPPPPVDPRDIPAQDGPFTYLLYHSLDPLNFAEQDD